MRKTLITFLLTLVYSINAQSECTNTINCLEEIEEINETTTPNTNCFKSKTLNTIEASDEKKSLKINLKVDENSWKYAITGLAVSPGLFILGTAIHESSHCLAAELQNFECFDIRVIPYKDEETGYFYFGSMKYKDPLNLRTPDKDALVTIAPMITNATLIGAYSTLAFSNKLPKNKWAKTATFLLGTTQVVDLFNHVQNTQQHSDSGKLINYLQRKKGIDYNQAFRRVKGPQIGVALLGTGALALEGVRIFTTPKERQDQKIQIVPSAIPQGFHLGIHGEF